jgi:tape measure domain-containing protein
MADRKKIGIEITASQAEALKAYADLKAAHGQQEATVRQLQRSVNELSGAMRENQARADTLRVQVALGKAELDRLGQSVSKRAPEYLALSQEVKALETSLRAADQAAANSARQYDRAAVSASKMEAAVREQKAALEQSRVAFAAAGVDVHNLGSEYARLTREAEQAVAASARAAAQAERRRAAPAALDALGAQGSTDFRRMETRTAQNAQLSRQGMQTLAELRQMENQARGVASAIRQVFDALLSRQKTLREGMTSISDQLASMRRLAFWGYSLVGGYQVARSFISILDAGKRLQGQLRLVTEDERNLAEVQDRLIQIADDTRTGLESTTALYVRVARSTKDYNVTQEQNLAFTQAVNEAFRITGASADEAAAGVWQLSQAIQKGKLNDDDYISVATNAPLIIDALAKHWKVGREEMAKYAEQGKHTSDVLIKAVLAVAPEWHRQFQQIGRTAEEAFVQMRNDVINAFRDIDNKELINSIDEFRKTLSDPQTLSSITQFAQAVVEGFGLAGDAIKGVKEHADAVVALMTAYAGARIGGAVAGPAGAVVGGVAGLLLSPDLKAEVQATKTELDRAQRELAAKVAKLREVQALSDLDPTKNAWVEKRAREVDAARKMVDSLQAAIETGPPAPVKVPVAPEVGAVDTSNIEIKPDVQKAIREAAAKYAVPVDLVKAVAKTESNFDQGAVSSKGGRGVMQLMPATAERFKVDPNDLRQNVQGGTEYLRVLLDKYKGDVTRALAAYNWGEGNVDKFGLSRIPEETKKFIEKIQAELKNSKLGESMIDLEDYKRDLAEASSLFEAQQNHSVAIAEAAQTKIRADQQAKEAVLDAEMAQRARDRAAALLALPESARPQRAIENAGADARDAEEAAQRRAAIEREALVAEEAVAQAKLRSLQAERAKATEFEKSAADRLNLEGRISQAEADLAALASRRGQIEKKASEEVAKALLEEKQAEDQLRRSKMEREQAALNNQQSLLDTRLRRVQIEQDAGAITQAEARERVAAAYRESAAAIEANITAMQRLAAENPGNVDMLVQAERAKNALMEMQTGAVAASRGPFRQMAMQWRDTTTQMEQAAVNWTSSAADAFAQMAVGNKISSAEMAKAMLADLIRITIQALIARAAMSFFGGLAGGGGANAAAGAGATNGLGAINVGGLVAAKHTGGLMSEAGMTRHVPLSIFAEAPRYHTGGLVGRERPAVLLQDEGVFTPGQMQAMASLSIVREAVLEAQRAMPPQIVVSIPPTLREPPAPRWTMPEIRAPRAPSYFDQAGSSAGTGGGTPGGYGKVTIVDNRKQGEPDIQTTERQGPNGRELEIQVYQMIDRYHDSGRADRVLRKNYGLVRQGGG